MEQLGVVDTSVVIAFLRGENSVSATFRSLLERDRVILSTVSIFELRLGEDLDQNSSLDSLFEVVKIADFDQSIAGKAANIYRRLEQDGERIGLRDTFIGATAIEEGVPVYTLNADHFERIPGLDVLDPSQN